MQKSILVAVDKWKYIAKYKTRIKRTKKAHGVGPPHHERLMLLRRHVTALAASKQMLTRMLSCV